MPEMVEVQNLDSFSLDQEEQPLQQIYTIWIGCSKPTEAGSVGFPNIAMVKTTLTIFSLSQNISNCDKYSLWLLISFKKLYYNRK